MNLWPFKRNIAVAESAEERFAAEVLRSMREEGARWSAPDHGWAVDLLCRRDDGLEVMYDAGRFDEPGKVRIQPDSWSKLHFDAVSIRPTAFNAAGALLVEMKRLLSEKAERKAAKGLAAIMGASKP